MKSGNYILLIVIALFISGACSLSDSASDGSADSGSGGSMARFTVAGDYLYTVDNEMLKVFNISVEESPGYEKNIEAGWGIETIFPLGNKLFLGTSSGMHIYDISTGNNPQPISFYQHVIACDPVVSDGDFAYVTLNGSRDFCWRTVDELQIIDLHDISNPQLIRQIQMDSPQGLAIRNDTLWVCDNGLKIYDVSDKQNIRQLHHFTGINSYDIILNKNLAIVVGENKLVQYKLEGDTIVKVSVIHAETGNFHYASS